MAMARLKLLILGGTTEASALARALGPDPRFDLTLSLAGRTRNPVLPDVPCRIGGFGGIEGLAYYLAAEKIEALVDATHPFAAQISRHAVLAAAKVQVPLLGLRRLPWESEAGDHWIEVADMASAAAALGHEPRRVFLAVGRQELGPFRAEPQHEYVIRSVDAPAPDDLPRRARVLTARGPFADEDEARLFADLGIEILVTKNSGGAATRGKLTAARRLGIPVVMVRRPELPAVEAVPGVPGALLWLEDLLARAHGAVPAERGV